MGMYPSLAGKVAIVTGAGRPKGLGEAIALRLAAEGAKVVVHDIGRVKGEIAPEHGVGKRAEIEQVVATIRAAGGTAELFQGDVLVESDVEAMVAFAVQTYGKLDIMVNNAGIGYLFGPLTEMSQEKWDAVLGVNLRGCFFGMKYAARQMLQQGGGGSIVSIGSQASKSGFAQATAYTASKHGLMGLTRAAALEFGPNKIRVNMVCPNHVTTGLGSWQNEFMSKARGQTLEQYLAEMRGRIPLGRVGVPEDTAKAVAFLCSDEAEYITGESMNVSGGEEYH
jgi:meso-butanediol dehydrogenase/(S,S)-butanediol dehydrogenase/diacetyl reductase